TAVRGGLLVLLGAILLSDPGRTRVTLRGILGLFSKKRGATMAAMLLLFLFPRTSLGQSPDKPAGPSPDKQMLDALRERLLKPSDAFPHAADIANAKLQLRNGRLTVESEVHAALDVAVPLPGRLPTWSPVSVKIDDKPADIPLCR